MIKFDSGFSRKFRFPTPMKIDLHDITDILLNVTLSTLTVTPKSRITKDRQQRTDQKEERKRQTITSKALHRKLKIYQTEPH